MEKYNSLQKETFISLSFHIFEIVIDRITFVITSTLKRIRVDCTMFVHDTLTSNIHCVYLVSTRVTHFRVTSLEIMFKIMVGKAVYLVPVFSFKSECLTQIRLFSSYDFAEDRDIVIGLIG